MGAAEPDLKGYRAIAFSSPAIMHLGVQHAPSVSCPLLLPVPPKRTFVPRLPWQDPPMTPPGGGVSELSLGKWVLPSPSP